MIEVPSFNGVTVAVLGLGRSGLSAARALFESGAVVWAWDDNEASRDQAQKMNIPLVDLAACGWSDCKLLVLSPGIPHTYPSPHPIAAKAMAAGVKIVCDVELLVRTQRSANYVGITGTNGKSTTTALIAHILQKSGERIEIGGNFGIPALDLEPLDEGAIYVLEMSSYQLERTSAVPFNVAVLLNISADHLERHGGMQGYIAAKKTIFKDQNQTHTAVIGVDDPLSKDVFHALQKTAVQKLIPISGSARIEAGVYVLDGNLFDDTDGSEKVVCDLKTIASLPGNHNWQNAAAAYATAKAMGVPSQAIVDGLQSYPGLIHRQEAVAIVDGVAFVNDSKATNADAASRALRCYENIYWIAGGRSKDGGLKGIEAHLKDVRHAYLVGESAADFASYLKDKVVTTISGEMNSAVSSAYKSAKDDGYGKPVVLLSPACASFDQFPSFEARGDAFKSMVEALPGTHQNPLEKPGLLPLKGFQTSTGEAA